MLRFRFDRRHTQERNDCTVRTLSLVTGLSYEKAYEILEYYGRRPNRGFHWDFIMQVLKQDFKKEFELYSQSNIENGRYKKYYTVKDLTTLPKFKKGSYAILVREHVFSMIDGVIVDTFRHGKKRKVVHAIYKYKHK